jgi:penicillin-binding protein 2
MTVTPLQQAQMVATIASRGRNFKPRLVTRLRDPETGELTVIAPERLADVAGIPPEDWQRVFNGMVGTLTRGTARAIGSQAPYAIAGKTGTAQVFSVGKNEKYVESQVAERLRDHSWFVAFAPAEAPRIAIAVLVENGGFGASAAAPIARQVMDAYLLPRTAPTPETQQPSQPPPPPPPPAVTGVAP